MQYDTCGQLVANGARFFRLETTVLFSVVPDFDRPSFMIYDARFISNPHVLEQQILASDGRLTEGGFGGQATPMAEALLPNFPWCRYI